MKLLLLQKGKTVKVQRCQNREPCQALNMVCLDPAGREVCMPLGGREMADVWKDRGHRVKLCKWQRPKLQMSQLVAALKSPSLACCTEISKNQPWAGTQYQLQNVRRKALGPKIQRWTCYTFLSDHCEIS